MDHRYTGWMTRAMTPKERLAAQAWSALFDFIVATSRQRADALVELGLSVNDSRALGALDPHDGRTMRSLAQEWRCDPSTATWAVDRLERKGLARRQPHPIDRRALHVLLTSEGERVRDELRRRNYAPPPELLALPIDTLRQLRDAAAQLPALRTSQPLEGDTDEKLR